MINRICEVCGEFNSGDNWVNKLSDKDGFVEINGHEKCIDQLHKKIKNVKDLDKKSVQKVLDEIQFVRI
jgi:hypothetical protein